MLNNDDKDVDGDLDDAPREKSSTPTRKRRTRNELSQEEKEEAKHQKTYLACWEELPEFQQWLKPVKRIDSSKAHCCVCGTNICCGKSELEKHAKGKKHVKNLKIVKSCAPINKALGGESAATKLQSDVKKAEITLSAVFAEHNMAVQIVDQLLPTLKSVFPDSKIAASMTLGRTKCSQIIKNVISKVEADEIVQTVRKVPFSVMLDGSTYITLHKSMCCLVRYVSPKTGAVCTQLLELIDINATDCSANALYTAFKGCLQKYDIPLSNIVGYGSDNENTMIGRHNSIWSRLQVDAPAAIQMGSVCHSSASTASRACKQLPGYLEEFITNVTGYVGDSAKRQGNLEEFQLFFEAELHKILKLAPTRWLCRQACVARVLEQWVALIQLFTVAAAEEAEKGAKKRPATKILDDFYKPMTKAYLLFLNYSLNYFNNFNAMMQTNKVIIHQLKIRSIQLIQEMAQNYVKPEYIENLNEIHNPGSLMPPEEVYLGPSCEEYLNKVKEEWDPDDQDGCVSAISEMRENCLSFYKEAAEDLIDRLPSVSDPLYKEMQFLDPKIALSGACPFRCENRQLCLLPVRYKDVANLDLDALAHEWRTMPFAVPKVDRKRIVKMEPDIAWAEIGALKSLDGMPRFPEIGLSQLARCVLALPHANADSERVFSMVTDVCSKKRNKIGGECLNAICVTRSAFQAKKMDCTTFKVQNEHLALHNQTMYSHIK